VDSWLTLLFIVLIVTGWFRLRSSWALFATGVLLLPYLTLSGGSAGFVSMSRFNLVSFPLFVVMADVGLRAKWLLIGVIGLFSAALFMNAALFARRIGLDKAGIAVPSKDKLPGVVDTLISPVRAGELDDMFAQASKQRVMPNPKK